MYERVTITAEETAQLVPVRVAVLDLLRSLGITTIFGNPGSTELPLLKEFPQDFRYVLGMQECCVMGMADGFAQATRNASFVNLHAAAGVGHALGNLFTAYRNRTPIIVTAGQQARSILPYEPFLYAQQATEFPHPYVKWSVEPARAQDVPLAIARAYHVAMTPPCGPVFVSIPVDDWEEQCLPVDPRPVQRITRGDPALLAQLGDALDHAKKPVFVTGAATSRDQAWPEIIELAERHKAPVWETPHWSRAGFPQDHKLFQGFLVAARHNITADLAGHDLIVAIGAPLFTYHVEGGGPHAPAGAKVFQIIDDPDIASWCPTGTSIVSSIKPALQELLARPAPKARRTQPPARANPSVPDSKILTDQLLFATLNKLRPANAVIVEECPSSRPAMQEQMPIIAQDGFYSGASGGLGWSLPAAVGVAMVRPEARVIAVLGDGSSMYAIQGLYTAAAMKLPMTFIIIKNGRYEALIRFSHFFGMQTLVGARFPELDFVSIAQGMGLHAFRAAEPTDLEPTLREALATRGPSLVEVVVE